MSEKLSSDVFMVYSMKDKLSGRFAPPFYALNQSVAIRQVRSMFARVPREDLKEFSLYLVGAFDMALGVMAAEEEPLLVVEDITPYFKGLDNGEETK